MEFKIIFYTFLFVGTIVCANNTIVEKSLKRTRRHIGFKTGTKVFVS